MCGDLWDGWLEYTEGYAAKHGRWPPPSWRPDVKDDETEESDNQLLVAMRAEIDQLNTQVKDYRHVAQNEAESWRVKYLHGSEAEAAVDRLEVARLEEQNEVLVAGLTALGTPKAEPEPQPHDRGPTSALAPIPKATTLCVRYGRGSS
jgi:hypothetical protein